MTGTLGALRRYLASALSSLRDRNFRLYATGQAISVSGTWMQKLAQAWLILDLTGSGFMLGLVAALQQLPTLLFATLAGTIADRFPKRTILVCTAAAGAFPALTIGVALRAGHVGVWLVMLAAVTQGFIDAADKPARLTLVNDIADVSVLPNAVALNNIIQDTGKLVGPALGGVVIGSLGLAATFFVNAVFYLPVIVALLMIRPLRRTSPAPEFAGRGGLRVTLGYVRRRPALLSALGLMTVTGLLAYNWSLLVPLLVRNSLAGTAQAVGLGFASLGLGGVLGGFAVAGVLRPSTRAQIRWGAVLGSLMIALALSPGLPTAYALLFLVGAASVTFKSITMSFMQLSVDAAMRGRVTSLYVVALTGTTPIGAPLQGAIAEIANPRVALGFGAVATLVATGCARIYLGRREVAIASDGGSAYGESRHLISQISDLKNGRRPEESKDEPEHRVHPGEGDRVVEQRADLERGCGVDVGEAERT